MKELLIAFILAQTTDMATTHIGLSRGCQELNPIYGGRNVSIGTMYVIKGTSTVIISVVAWNSNKKGRKGSAKVILWTGIAAGAGAAIWNGMMIPHCGG